MNATLNHAVQTPQPTLHELQANGVRLACWEWRPELRGQGPTLLMVHATGFHGRVWDQTIRHLQPMHVLAIEQRGHGRSEAAHFDSWEPFGRDLAAAVAQLDLQGAIGIGHSMGAHALVQAAAYEPKRFARLILVDPVLQAPAAYHLPPVAPGTLHPSANRKNQFESVDAMVERFADRTPYVVFDRQALRDYCQWGLRPADDGVGLQLACAPSFEGRIYPIARNQGGVYASIRALHIPVWVLRAKPQDPAILPWDPLGSPTWPGLAAEFRQGSDIQFLDKSHFLPMEDPALMADLIQQALAGAAAPVRASIPATPPATPSHR